MTVPISSQCPRCRVTFYLPQGWDRCPLCRGRIEEGAASARGATPLEAAPAVVAGEEFECRLCGQQVADDETHCPRCGTIFDPPTQEVPNSMRLLHQVEVAGQEEPILVEVWEDKGAGQVCHVSCPICGNRVTCGNLACPRCGTMLDQLDPRSREGDLPLVAPIEEGRGKRPAAAARTTLRISAERN